MSHHDAVSTVSFGEAISLYFKNYGNFRTRSRRSEYWKAQLFLMLVNGAIGALTVLVPMLSGILGIASAIWALAIIIPTMSLQVRRLHDIGKSGWWYLMPAGSGVLTSVVAALLASGDVPEIALIASVIPLIAAIVMLVWMCTDSKEDNEWGPNPKHSNRRRISSHGEVVVERDPAAETPRENQAGFPDHGENRSASSADANQTVFNPLDSAPPVAQPVVLSAANPAVLTVCSGPLKGAIYLCDTGKSITIGRAASCDVSLPKYESVSGRHCRVTAGAGCITLVDLNSTNGTLVNGQKLPAGQSVTLRHGSTFCLGSSGCTIQVRFQ